MVFQAHVTGPFSHERARPCAFFRTGPPLERILSAASSGNPCGEGLQENPYMRFPSRFARRLFIMAFLLAGLGLRSGRVFAAEECAANAGSHWIVAFPAELESQLRAEGVEIWDRDD